MSISASEARKTLFPLIERVNEDRDAVEIVSRKGNAVLMPADEYAAWQETAYLFHSPAEYPQAARRRTSVLTLGRQRSMSLIARIGVTDASGVGSIRLGGL